MTVKKLKKNASSTKRNFVRREPLGMRLANKVRETPWQTRLGYSALVGALIVLTGWRLDFPWSQSAIVAGVGIAIVNIVAVMLPWTPVILAWVANLGFLPMVATGYMSLDYTGTGLDTLRGSVAISILVVSSALFTLIAYMFAPGRLWVTLTGVFVSQNVLGWIVASSFYDSPVVLLLGPFVSVLFGALFLVVRIFFMKPLKSRLFTVQSAGSEKVNSLKKKLSTALNKGTKGGSKYSTFILPEGVKSPGFLVVSKSGVWAVFPLTNSERLTLKGSKVKLGKKSEELSNLTAPYISIAKTIATINEIPMVETVLTSPVWTGSSQALRVEVSSRESTVLGSAVLVEERSLSDYLAKSRQAQRVTESTVDRIRGWVEGEEVEGG